MFGNSNIVKLIYLSDEKGGENVPTKKESVYLIVYTSFGTQTASG